MRKILAVMLSVIMLVTLAGCGQSKTDSSNSAAGETEQSTEYVEEQTTEQTAAEQDTSEETTEANTETTEGRNVLVAYFSLAGEQYKVGVIEEGNTSIVAKMIAEQTGADLFEIEPVNEYPSSHRELLSVAQNEQRENARPEIKNKVENMDDYDTVYIGYPNWWGDMPMIVYHFLESYDFNGKIVIPFCTHGGSGLSGTESTIAGICDGAEMLSGFAIEGETAQNDRERTKEAVTEWLKEIGK